MVMYAIDNIAKFERRQTSERISVNFQAKPEEGGGFSMVVLCLAPTQSFIKITK